MPAFIWPEIRDLSDAECERLLGVYREGLRAGAADAWASAPAFDWVEVDDGEGRCPRCQAIVVLRDLTGGAVIVTDRDGALHTHAAPRSIKLSAKPSATDVDAEPWPPALPPPPPWDRWR